MYLHKNGCDYFIAVFKNLKNETINAKKNNTDHLSALECLEYKNTNPIKFVEELLVHATNIQTHIKSEENVLKALINRAHQIAFGELKKPITDPEFIKLSQILQQLAYMEQGYALLHKEVEKISSTITAIQSGNQKELQADHFIDQEQLIAEILEDISSRNTDFAKKLKEFIQSIQKEAELIKKEEEVITDFNKNLMSWF